MQSKKASKKRRMTTVTVGDSSNPITKKNGRELRKEKLQVQKISH